MNGGEIMNYKENYNFVAYGDSITKGVVFDNERGRYVVLKDNFINLVQNKVKGAIYNMGKFGNDIIRGKQKLEKDVIKKHPDIVIIEFGGNDCDFDWEAVAKDPKGIHEPKTDLNLFENTLNDFIDYFRKLNITPVLMNLPPLEPERYFKWICKQDPVAEKNVLSWLGTINKIYTWQEQYSDKVVQVAKKCGTEFIDIRTAFLKEKDIGKYICIDGIHPNNFGHKLIAESIMEYLNLNYKFLLK